MAKLINKKIQKIIILHSNHTFGRNSDVNITALMSPFASRDHGVIVWDGGIWKIKDNSTNGIYLDGHRITPGRFYPLVGVKHIQFSNASTELWEILDLAPPVTGLIPIENPGEVISLHDVFVLPIKNRNIVVYLSEYGRWLCEYGNELSELYSGDKVGAEGQYWYFVDGSPTDLAATAILNPTVNNIQFQFKASQNEEHVSLKLIVNNSPINLGERNHHYLLLLLAKQRIADRKKRLPELEQGWIKKEILVKMMGMVEQHINIQVHRFRKQLSSELDESTSVLHQVIERRPGELRFAYSDITITGGFELSYSTA